MVRVLKPTGIATAVRIDKDGYNLRPDGEGTETPPGTPPKSDEFGVTTYDPMVRVLKPHP